MKHTAGWGGNAFALMAGVVLLLWLSGWVMHWLPAAGLAELSPTEEGLRRTCAVAHGVLSWLFCVACGRGVWPHVLAMWRRLVSQRQWLWGLSTLVFFVFLALSGLLLLYASAEVHDLLSPWHFWAGAAIPLVLLVHARKRFRRTPMA